MNSPFEPVIDSEESLANQIQTQIETLIRTGKLSEGQRLPSFRVMSEQFGVSIGTIRQALEIMKTKGILDIQHGRGAFISSKNTGKIMNIVFICPALDSSQLNKILSGINEFFINRKVHLILKIASRAYQNEIETIVEIDPADYDGCLIYPPASNMNADAFESLKDKGLPFVFIDTIPTDMDVNAVTTDCHLQGFMAVDYLISKGHRKIGIVDHNGTAVTNQLRRVGFESALAKINASLATIPYVQIPVTDPKDSSRFCPRPLCQQLIQDLLTNNPDMTAVVGIHENMTIEIMHACHETGMRVPDDISVIGLGNSEAAIMAHPFLTIVDSTPELIGMRAAKRLIEIIEHKRKCSEKILLTPKLVENSSVKTIK